MIQLSDSFTAALFFILSKYGDGPTKPQLQLETKNKCSWKQLGMECWISLFSTESRIRLNLLLKKERYIYADNAQLLLHVESALCLLLTNRLTHKHSSDICTRCVFGCLVMFSANIRPVISLTRLKQTPNAGLRLIFLRMGICLQAPTVVCVAPSVLVHSPVDST